MKLLLPAAILTTFGIVTAQTVDLTPVLAPADGTFDFNIVAPTVPDPFDSGFGQQNTLSTFKFDLEGLEDQGDDFKLKLSACNGEDGVFSPSGGDLALATTVTLTNPATAFTEETWCIKAELTLPDGGTGGIVTLAELDFTVTLTLDGSGSFSISSSAVNIELPATTTETAVTATVNDGNPVSLDNFIASGIEVTLGGSPIVLGTTFSVGVGRKTGGGIPPEYKFKITSLTASTDASAPPEQRIDLVPTLDPLFSDNPSASFDTTKLPLEIFTQSSTIFLFVSIAWELPSRRRLRVLQGEEPASGSFEAIIGVDVRLPSGSGAFRLVSLKNAGASFAAFGAAALLI